MAKILSTLFLLSLSSLAQEPEYEVAPDAHIPANYTFIQPKLKPSAQWNHCSITHSEQIVEEATNYF